MATFFVIGASSNAKPLPYTRDMCLVINNLPLT